MTVRVNDCSGAFNSLERMSVASYKGPAGCSSSIDFTVIMAVFLSRNKQCSSNFNDTSCRCQLSFQIRGISIALRHSVLLNGAIVLKNAQCRQPSDIDNRPLLRERAAES